MKIKIIAVANKMPKWVEDGYTNYIKRLPTEIKIELISIKPEKRSKNTIDKKAIDKEGSKILAKIQPDETIINLDLNHKQLTTMELAEKFKEWTLYNKKISFVIGGADGLSETCKQAADYNLCLSALTLPHPLVKIMLAESIYRSWTIIHKMPYNRE